MTDNLRILCIFHYVVGGLHALLGSIGLFHVAFGLIVLLSPDLFASSNGQAPPPPAFFGLLFVIVGGGIVLTGWTLGFLTILSGGFIAKRKRRMFSLVMGCINCVLLPFGMVLGIFDIILLTREDVKALYGEAPGA